VQPLFPARLEELSPELLTAALARHRPGVVVERVGVAERARCGDGIASTADRVVLELELAPGRGDGVPSRVMLKTILLHRHLRFGLPVILGIAAALNRLDAVPVLRTGSRPLVFTLINVYQRFFPHAPAPMYDNEVRFYRDIRDELEIECPRVYASVFDERTGQFGIVMEDLRLRGARFPNATTPTTLDEVAGLVSTLARLHAQFWASPRLERDLRWVVTTSSGGMYRVFEAIGLDLIRDQVSKNAFKQELIAPLRRSLDQLWRDVWAVQAALDADPVTLCHGDAHIANTYLLPDGSGGLLDWQLMVKGSWAHDLTYLLVTGLETGQRRRHERDLITHYLDELRALGVARPPNRDEAWLRYRQCVVWGLVIGWLITPPQNYGRAVTEANIRRLVAAARDLETFRALP
jgi:aminoglycoside phosphotransferase (APT) family kinase protein